MSYETLKAYEQFRTECKKIWADIDKCEKGSAEWLTLWKRYWLLQSKMGTIYSAAQRLAKQEKT